MATKVPKFALLDKCLCDVFNEAQIWYYNNFKSVLGRFWKGKENSSLNMTVFDQFSC